ncbi:SPOR domain-containing protein [candidate division TA06 bacterium]|nr:SPOR domain-containing protein [candidate division TA06 bacterium]
MNLTRDLRFLKRLLLLWGLAGGLRESAFLSILLFSLVFLGCRQEEKSIVSKESMEPKSETVEFPSPPPEDLEGFSLYLLKKKSLVIIHLEREKVVKKVSIPEELEGGEFSSDGQVLYLFTKRMILPFHLPEGELLKGIALKENPLLTLINPRGEEIFTISPKGTLSVFRFAEGSEEVRDLFIEGRPKKCLLSSDGTHLFVTTEGTFLQIDWRERKILQKKEIPVPVDFLLSPYGKKVYWLGKTEMRVLESETLKEIKTIPLQGNPIGLRTTPAGNKVYLLFEKAIWVLRTASLRLETKMDIEGQLRDFLISPDGSFAFAMVESASLPESGAADPDRGGSEENRAGGSDSADGPQLLILDLGLDRVITSLPLPHSALPIRNSDIVSIPKGEFGIRRMVFTPEGSRLYLLTDSLYRVDVGKREIFPILAGKGGEALLINTVPITPLPKEEVKVVRKTRRERDVFTIQVSSHLEKKGAESGLLQLRSYGYPAYLVTSTTREGVWYRVRVGGFATRVDGEVMAEKIGGILRRRLWVTRSRIDPTILPEVPLSGRDLNGDGKREEAVLVDDKRILLFSLDRGFFQKVFETQKGKETYSGEPEFKDLDGDGTLEVVTPLLIGDSLSVIDWGENGFFERIVEKEVKNNSLQK